MTSLVVRVVPRSSRDSVEGRDGDGVVHLRVTAAPAEGAANASVEKLLARLLRVPRTSLSLASGRRSRIKRFAVPLDPKELERRLAGLERL
ncbi:MAG: DUF167 family protein [Dehalococcoidia bacterium]